MNCSNAQLEIARMKAADAVSDLDPAWEQLADHFVDCPACEKSWLGWDAFDDRIADAMQDVEIPSDGAASVLALLEQSADEPVEPSDAEAETTAPSRSLFKWSAVCVCAASVFVAVGLWMQDWSEAEPVIYTAATVQGGLPVSEQGWQGLNRFDDGFEFQLPQVGWARIPTSRDVKGWSFDGDASHEVAAVRFVVAESAEGAGFTGILAAIPVSELTESPAERFFDPSTVGYTARESSQFATVSWTEADMVYVCFVPKSGGALERLEKVLQSGTV